MKKISLFLAFIMVISLAVPCMAAEDISEYVVYVKERIDIPEECTEFDVSLSSDENKENHHFYWQTPEDALEYKYVSVTLNSDSIISDYYYHKDRDYSKQIPVIDKNDALKFAKDFMMKSNPGICDEFDFNLSNVSYNSNTYNVVAKRMVNGIEVMGQYAVYELSGSDGEMYSMSVYYDAKSEFDDADGIKQADDIYEIFKDGGLALEYVKFYGNEDNDIIYPYYISSDKYYLIDAKTGKNIDEQSFWSSNSTEDYAAGAMKESAVTDRIALTPKEKEEIANIKNLISTKDAEKVLKGIKEFNITKDYKIGYSNIFKDENENYIMNISFEKEDSKGYISASLDAENATVKNFGAYSSNNKAINKYSEEKALGMANKFAETYYADYVKNSDTEQLKIAPESEMVLSKRYRLVNGIPFRQDTLSVSVSKATGYVTYFNLDWEEDAVFEGIETVVGYDEAYNTLFEYAVPKILYYSLDKKKFIPVYYMDFGEVGGINALTGKPCDSDGEDYYTKEEMEYTDIEGHYAETAIKKLCELGIRFDENMFKPDSVITQGEYINLVSKCVYDYYPVYKGAADFNSIYDNAVARGIILKEDISPDASLTRELAVTYLLRAMGYEKLAKISGIFKTDFADSQDINEQLLGYVAIAKGLKIINGTEDNRFFPKKEMTRAEAATIIYNYLNGAK